MTHGQRLGDPRRRRRLSDPTRRRTERRPRIMALRAGLGSTPGRRACRVPDPLPPVKLFVMGGGGSGRKTPGVRLSHSRRGRWRDEIWPAPPRGGDHRLFPWTSTAG
ncbi:hypothetical protein ACRAWD_29730 [Caulobacter segnis]